eukprot:TRINITY_DN25081_c0_g1_i2.p1 TRINITY_DN25081_c0_g1~~TRINITY_DN25081_c0_g1_i2.p1  ORF type:complete len:274 (-),score=37.88 TRINITY_DN25081_c0_g1_i2:478-1299(-)
MKARWKRRLVTTAAEPLDLCEGACSEAGEAEEDEERSHSSSHRSRRRQHDTTSSVPDVVGPDARSEAHKCKPNSQAANTSSRCVDLVGPPELTAPGLSTNAEPAHHDAGVSKCVGRTQLQKDSVEFQRLLLRRGLLADVAKDIAEQADRDGVSRTRLRSLLWNLGRNSLLVAALNDGSVSSAQLLAMDDDDLATSDRREQKQRLATEALAATIVKDLDSFSVPCKGCGDPATGVMVPLGGNPLTCGGCEGGSRYLIHPPQELLRHPFVLASTT